MPGNLYRHRMNTTYDTAYVEATIRDFLSSHVKREEAKKLIGAIREGLPTRGELRRIGDEPLEAKLGWWNSRGPEKTSAFVVLEWHNDSSRLRLHAWPGSEGERSYDEIALPLEWDCLGPRWLGKRSNGDSVDAAWVVIEAMMERLMAHRPQH